MLTHNFLITDLKTALPLYFFSGKCNTFDIDLRPFKFFSMLETSTTQACKINSNSRSIFFYHNYGPHNCYNKVRHWFSFWTRDKTWAAWFSLFGDRCRFPVLGISTNAFFASCIKWELWIFTLGKFGKINAFCLLWK